MLYVFLLLFSFINGIYSICPNGLHSCECTERPDGFYVDCHEVSTDLNSLILSAEKMRIERLSVTRAVWPMLKRLPFTSMKSLHLISCEITEVEDNAFEQVSDNLEELVLSNNSLTSIPRFGDMPKLLSVNLNYNKLSTIPDGAFKNATRIKHLRFEGNKICEFSKDAFRETKESLELLDLSGNCIRKVPSENLRGFARLMYLDLSENEISSIEDFEFMNLLRLKELRLNDNHLREVATLAFKDVPSLQFMYLQRNSLTSFDTSSMIEGFRLLEMLDISHNQLNEVPVVKGLPNIRQVLMNNNNIRHIDPYTFSCNPKLQTISLEDNEISSISSNSFHRLDSLTTFLLGNNSIQTIDDEVLNGMKNLQQLNLRNNSLSELTNYTFNNLRRLSMLDLSNNGLHKIQIGAFKPLENLYWLDLSYNMLSTIKAETFQDSIPNIILYGNPIHCDEKIDWLVGYLLRNRVRTHLPFQPEVLCVTPKKYENVRLTDFLTIKANETFAAMAGAMKIMAGRSSGENILKSLLPAKLSKLFPGLQRTGDTNPYSNVPVVGAITETLPGLRKIPGLDYLPKVTGARAEDVHSLNSAIEKFSSPLIRVATGESNTLNDIDQMMQAIPDMAANMPGFGNLDLSTLPPNVLMQVLHGGQIPGIRKETLNKILKEHTSKMYAAAVAAKKGTPLADESRFLPPLEKLPQSLVAEFIKGGSLPFLNNEQMATIREYYTTKIASMISSGKAKDILPADVVTPQLTEMMKLLPPGYDISKIPPEVMQAVSEGKIPDITLLPSDLRDYILSGGQKLDVASKGKTIEEILRNVPTTARPDIPMVSPYDINKVSVDLINAEKEAQRKERIQFWSRVLLCIVGAVSTVVIVLLFLYMKRKYSDSAKEVTDRDSYSSEGSRFHRERRVMTPRERSSNIPNHSCNVANHPII